MKIKKYDAKNLSKNLFDQCINLSFRSDGEMSRALRRSRKYNWISGKCYIILEKNKIIAWSIVYQDEQAYFYTRKTHRKMGYGSRLAEEIKKDYPSIIGVKHDNISKIFFDKVNYKSIDESEFDLEK